MSEYLASLIKIITVFVLLIALTFCVGNAYAKIIKVDVEGLVCDFCAQSIEKVFMKQPGVEVVYVNLDRGNVHIKMEDVFKDDEEGISEIRIKNLFKDSGYNVTSIIRK